MTRHEVTDPSPTSGSPSSTVAKSTGTRTNRGWKALRDAYVNAWITPPAE
ncbi:MAG TPA: hypothetical protein VGM05_25920 [Planctomycetaceae bacterium]